MKNISRIDLTLIISALVVALVGGGVWYYLSGEITSAQQDVAAAKADFDNYSSKQAYLPTSKNVKILQANIDLLKAQLDPLIQARLQASGNKLADAANEDTVAWKHKLDDDVRNLNAAAKLHGIDIPPNFYYGFSRYVGQNPAEEKTAVLSKQLLGIEQIANILINAPVKAIRSSSGAFPIRRTFEEEESHGPGAEALAGHAITAPGGSYIAYPFEIEFDATIDALRKVINDSVQSPYLLIIRSLTIQNSQPDSPQIGTLDQIAGTPQGSILDSPGEAAAAKSSVGPQFLFGSESIHVLAKIDLIEWLAVAPQTRPAKPSSSPGANR